jgi:hypothetical protein
MTISPALHRSLRLLRYTTRRRTRSEEFRMAGERRDSRYPGMRAFPSFSVTFSIRSTYAVEANRTGLPGIHDYLRLVLVRFALLLTVTELMNVPRAAKSSRTRRDILRETPHRSRMDSRDCLSSSWADDGDGD